MKTQLCSRTFKTRTQDEMHIAFHKIQTLLIWPKFADDTSVVGLISNNDETHYREEVAQLAEWCGANKLSLNVGKTNIEEVVMDFRINFVDHLTIDSSTVERVSSTKFLGVHITEVILDHQHHVTLQEGTTAPTLSPPAEKSKSPSTHPHHLLQGNHLERINQLRSAADRKTLQQTINTAAKIIGAPLPSIQDILLTRRSSKANSIMKDTTHPSHHLFQLLPS